MKRRAIRKWMDEMIEKMKTRTNVYNNDEIESYAIENVADMINLLSSLCANETIKRDDSITCENVRYGMFECAIEIVKNERGTRVEIRALC